jgi:hypothetical protein
MKPLYHCSRCGRLPYPRFLRHTHTPLKRRGAVSDLTQRHHASRVRRRVWLVRKTCTRARKEAWRVPDFRQPYEIAARGCFNSSRGDQAMPLKIYRRPGSPVWNYRGTLAGNRLRGTTGASDKETAQRIASAIEDKFWKRGLDSKEKG